MRKNRPNQTSSQPDPMVPRAGAAAHVAPDSIIAKRNPPSQRFAQRRGLHHAGPKACGLVMTNPCGKGQKTPNTQKIGHQLGFAKPFGQQRHNRATAFDNP